MKLNDESILEALRQGKHIYVRSGEITIGLDSEDFARTLATIGDLKYKDWEVVENDT